MPAQSTLLLPEGYSDNRLVSDLTRRQFGFGAGIAGLGAFLAACGDSGSSSGETEMRSVTTPLGTYDIPVNPKRVVAIDSRLDLEPAVALELPLVATRTPRRHRGCLSIRRCRSCRRSPTANRSWRSSPT